MFLVPKSFPKSRIYWEKYNSIESFHKHFSTYDFQTSYNGRWEGAGRNDVLSVVEDDPSYKALINGRSLTDWDLFFGKHGLTLKIDQFYSSTLNRLSKKLHTLLAERKDLINGIQGFKVDVPNYLNGRPDYMKRYKSKDGHVKGLDILFMNEFAGHYSIDNVYLNLVMMAIIKGLEIDGGFKINLHGGTFSRFHGEEYSHLTTVHIKHPDEHLSLFKHGPWLLDQIVFRLATKVRESAAYRSEFRLWSGEGRCGHKYTPLQSTINGVVEEKTIITSIKNESRDHFSELIKLGMNPNTILVSIETLLGTKSMPSTPEGEDELLTTLLDQMLTNIL